MHADTQPKGKALVTGGAGFIGSHLSQLLLDDGWEVFALDDLSTGSIGNVAHLREHPAFHLVVDSVLSPSVVNELVYKCDVVYHLAAAVGVELIVESPVRTIETNVHCTEVVIPYEEAYEAGFEDMPRRYPDVGKIEGALGWQATRPLTRSSATSSAISRPKRRSSDRAVRRLAAGPTTLGRQDKPRLSHGPNATQ